jgi:hypothetical protein
MGKKMNKTKIKIILFGDIETYIDINNTHIPFLIGFTHNFNSYIFQGINMFKEFFDKIIQIYKNKIVIYFHNLSKFDGILILNYLTQTDTVCDILSRDNSIYKITIKK